MPEKQDSIQLKTVIAYPQQKEEKQAPLVAVASQRHTKEALPLYTPSYDFILEGTTIFSALLLLMIHLYAKNQNSKFSFLSKYFSPPKREDGQINLQGISLFQHLLSYTVVIALGYYFLISNSSFVSWQAWRHVAIGLLGFIVARTFLILLTGYFTGNRSLSASHHGIVRFLNKLLGLLLLPFVWVALLLPHKGYHTIVYSVMVLLIIKIIIQLIFVYKLLRARNFSVFHSFLYLCTLEVLPIVYIIVVIVRFLTNK